MRSPRRAGHGWASSFPVFKDSPARGIRSSLEAFVRGASEVSTEQIRAWDESIPPLQREVGEVLARDRDSTIYSTILEYELPYEARRPDVVFLVRGGVVIVELKGRRHATQADIDQVAAYARDLRCYHRDCDDRVVTPVLVPTQATGYIGVQQGVHIVGPDHLDQVVCDLAAGATEPPVLSSQFLSEDAYRPLPTIVEAARELFERGDIRYIKRARAHTDPCLERLSAIVHEAARTRTRRLILVTGVPGAGKTLVGLELVHKRFLDDLAVERSGGKPPAPAVFLSGNGPLVEVLQYQLRAAGGGGKTFVRGVKDYIKTHARRRVPTEHVVVFDEAQRAWDADRVAAKQDLQEPASEPELLLRAAARIPDWCVVVGLVGTGQEIYVGEEGGLPQWRTAIDRLDSRHEWSVYGSQAVGDEIQRGEVPFVLDSILNLDVEVRQHSARHLHDFVRLVLQSGHSDETSMLAHALEQAVFHLRLTRDLSAAKQYLHDRYEDDYHARYGILASARDKALQIPEVRRFGIGPWFSDPEDASESQSCRWLRDCATEFVAQGLELDGVLLHWGTDFRRVNDRWDDALAKSYRKQNLPKDPFRIRQNAYRVLLTRARDVTVVYVPERPELDETFFHLRRCGFAML